MSIASVTVKQNFVGDGSTDTFAIPFVPVVSDSNEVTVYTRDESTNPATVELQVEGALQDYTLDGAVLPSDFNTDVVFNTPPAAGIIVTIVSTLALTQPLELTNNGSLNLEVLELHLDRIVRMIQQMNERFTRVPLLGVTEQVSESGMVMPDPEGESILGWNTAATALRNFTPTELALLAGSINGAVDITYDNASSGLTAVNVQAAIDELDTNLEAHIADSTDAHAASAVTNTPSGNLAATNVQSALNELQTDVDTRALASGLSDHLSDTTAAHAASAVSNTPSGNLAATDVQGALNELQSDIDTRATDADLTTAEGNIADLELALPAGDDYLQLQETASPPANPAAGYKRIYADTDGTLYEVNSAGVVSELGGSGGGGGVSLEWYFGDSNSPLEAVLSNGLRILDFAQSPDEQEMFVELKVPETYVAGTQIKLIDGKLFAALTTGNVLFKATSYIFKATIDGTSVPTGYNSTNTQVAVAGTTNQIVAVGDIDLTNASGQINSVAVAAGDTLLVKFYRDTSAETSGLAGDARLVRASFEPKFTA